MDAADRRRVPLSRAWRLLSALTLLLLAACASIPLGTLWKIRDFDAQTVQRIDPTVLRVAVAMQPDARIDPASAKLSLELVRTDGGKQPHAFPLEPANDIGPRSDDLRYSVWRLDAEGRRQFAEVQRKLRAAEASDAKVYASVSLSVKFKPEFTGPAPAETRLWVQLFLDPAGGWLLLFEDVRIRMQGA